MDFQAMVNDTNQKNSFMLHNGIQLTKMKRDHLIAEGRVKSRGTTLCVVEVEIRDETEKLLCGGTFTMFCVGKQDCISAE